MLKYNQKSTYLITDDRDKIVDIFQLEGYQDKVVNAYLQKKYPDTHENLIYKQISDAELLSAFTLNQHHSKSQEVKENYAKLLQQTTSIEAHNKYDTTELLDYLGNLQQKDLYNVITDTTINLLKLTTNLFLDGSDEGLISRTIVGVLSDYGEELQRGIKELHQSTNPGLKKSACIHDLISYFVVITGIYNVLKEHDLYNAKFLDFVLITKPYLEKIKPL